LNWRQIVPRLRKYLRLKFSSQSRPLSFQAIRTQINEGSPVLAGLSDGSGSGHVEVIVGYESISRQGCHCSLGPTQRVFFYDPYYNNQHVREYPSYVNGRHPTGRLHWFGSAFHFSRQKARW
jgi:hypothetical protein